MGVALWRRAAVATATPIEDEVIPRAEAGCWYRIEVFGRPRAPWRRTPTDAMVDAISLGLSSYDESQRQHYLAVPVDMRVRHIKDEMQGP